MKKLPPTARNIQALNKTLRLATRDIRRAGLPRRRLRRVALNLWSRGPLKIRPDRTACE